VYLSPLDLREVEVLVDHKDATGEEAFAVPLFGDAGGLNDRFAMGTPGAMQLYGNRMQAAHEHVNLFFILAVAIDRVKKEALQ